VVSAGTSGIIRNLMQVLAGPGDEVVVPLPYYPLYPFTARLAGSKVGHYRIDLRTMRIDLDSLAAAMTPSTRVVVINSPGNPLGNVMSREDLRAVDEVVDGRAVLLSDEMYGNVQFEGEPFSALELARDLRSPVIVTDGFSKAHRMYARRVGYAVVPEELVEPLEVIQDHTLLTADPVCQFGAIAALDHSQGVVELTRLYRGRRDYTLKRLAGVAGVTVLPAQGSFYVTLDCAEYLRQHAEEDSLPLARRLLERTGVATVPGMDFGLPGTLRLSFTAARYDAAIDRLATFFVDG
jgi:aspartate aminotransferase